MSWEMEVKEIDKQKLAEYGQFQEQLTKALIEADQKGDERAATEILKKMEELSKKYAGRSE